MKSIKYIALLFVSILIFQCSYMGKLSIPIRNYEGGKLKFNGFYCNVNNENDNQVIYYFYKNGFIYAHSTDDYKTAFKYPVDEEFNNVYKLPYFWGVYIVDSNLTITIERWKSDFGYSTLKFSGVIINDSIIVFDHPSKSVGIDSFYYFKSDWKPDSRKITFKDKIKTSW